MKLSLILTLLLASATAGKAADFFQLPFDPIAVNVGDDFAVDLGLFAGDDPVSAFQFDLVFPTFLSFNGITDTGYFAANGIGSFFDDPIPGSGTVTNIINLLTSVDLFSGSETILQFNFTATSAGAGNVGIQNEMLADASFNFLSVDTPTSPATVTVSSTPEPATVVPVATLAAAFLWRKRIARYRGHLPGGLKTIELP